METCLPESPSGDSGENYCLPGGVSRRGLCRNSGLDCLVLHIEKYSAIGPNVNAGKNESAATIIITQSSTALNAILSTFRVPALSGMYLFEASEAAMANGPMMGMNLASNITIP